jgi:quinol monooxygenase YgiN
MVAIENERACSMASSHTRRSEGCVRYVLVRSGSVPKRDF